MPDINMTTDNSAAKSSEEGGEQPLVKGEMTKSFLMNTATANDPGAQSRTEASKAAPNIQKDGTTDPIVTPETITTKHLAGDKTLGEIASHYVDEEKTKAMDEARERETERKRIAAEDDLSEEEKAAAANKREEETRESTEEEKTEAAEALKSKRVEQRKSLEQGGLSEEEVDKRFADEDANATKSTKLEVTREAPVFDDASKITEGEFASIESSSLPSRSEAARMPELTKEDSDFIAELSEDAQDEIDFLRKAAIADPTNFTGAYEKQMKYLRELAKVVEAIRTEDADAELEGDPRFEAAKKRHPHISNRNRRKANVEIIRQDLASTQETKLEERVRELELTPKVNRLQKTFDDTVYTKLGSSEDAGVKETIALIEEKGIEAARKADPDAIAAYESTQSAASADMRLFTALREDLIKFDRNNPAHMTQSSEVMRLNDGYVAYIAKNPTAALRDGKTFVHANDYWGKLTADQRGSYWTLNTPQMLALKANEAKAGAETAIKAVHAKRLEFLTQLSKDKNIPLEKLTGKPSAKKTPPVETGQQTAKQKAVGGATVEATRSVSSEDRSSGVRKKSFLMHGPDALK